MRFLDKLITAFCMSIVCGTIFAADKIEFFHLSDVEITDGPFSNAADVDKQYMLELDADRLLSPYLREAGLEPKAESYGNWENTGLDGHIGGHYLSALSMMYASTGDKDIKARLDYMISELARCQDNSGDGYIGGVPGSKQLWDEIKAGKIDASDFELNKKWVPLYNIHKPYAGLRDAYLHGGIEQAKEMLIKYTDWMIDITSGLSDEQVAQMLISEHGGLNEVFADVYDITGEEKYLELAKRFSDRRILDPLIRHEDKLTGMHANTQIPKVIGYQRIAELECNEEWHEASVFFWDNVVNKRSVSIGGNSVREYFHPIDNYTRMLEDREGPETCNTYNMMRLSMMLFSESGDSRYLDFYERAMFNHILSTQHPEKGGFVYFTSMRPGHYRVYSQPHTSFWCCVGSGLENHAKYGELIYAHQGDDLYVNLFVPSVLNWEDKGIVLTQGTGFPETNNTELILNLKKSKKFNIKIRFPEWMPGDNMEIAINGTRHTVPENNGFASINRKWKNGDRIEISLPMELRTEQIPDQQEFYSILYGPVVLGKRTHSYNMDGLFAGDGRGDHIATGKYYPMNENIAMIVSYDNDFDFLNRIERIKGPGLKFSSWDIYDPNPENLFKTQAILEPFYNIHESRYIVYFQKMSGEDYIKDYTERERGKARIVKEENTVDMVRPGEQQSESDHGYSSSGAATGVSHEERWRNAEGWFAYNLDSKNQQNLHIELKLWGSDKNGEFTVSFNGAESKKIKISGNREEFITEKIPLPKDINGIFEIKFSDFMNFEGSGIYEVRLMKAYEEPM